MSKMSIVEVDASYLLSLEEDVYEYSVAVDRLNERIKELQKESTILKAQIEINRGGSYE